MLSSNVCFLPQINSRLELFHYIHCTVFTVNLSDHPMALGVIKSKSPFLFSCCLTVRVATSFSSSLSQTRTHAFITMSWWMRTCYFFRPSARIDFLPTVGWLRPSSPSPSAQNWKLSFYFSLGTNKISRGEIGLQMVTRFRVKLGRKKTVNSHAL